MKYNPDLHNRHSIRLRNYDYANGVKTFKWKPFHKKLWQRNYYERIIRNEAEYARIAKYIRNNPILWQKKH